MRRSGVRILALVTEAWGGQGGIPQSTRDLLGAFAKMPGFGTVDVLPRLRPKLAAKAPDGISQHPPRLNKIAYALQALWLSISLRPNVVYCGHAFMAPLARLVARLAGAELVAHVHGLEIRGTPAPPIRRSIAACDLILCVSSHTANMVVEAFDVPSDRCAVIYNTVDERFMPGDRAAARARFGIPGCATVLSTVSRLDGGQRHKGHDLVIPLLHELSLEVPDLIYLVAGTGDDRGRLEELARNCGAGERVRFLGFVSDEDLPDLYRASDLYVMPSHGEGFGIAFVEAMCCGTPAIGLAVGGAPDALRDGELGRAVNEAEFPLALRDAIVSAQPNRRELAAHARATFGRHVFEARLAEEVRPLMSGIDVPK